MRNRSAIFAGFAALVLTAGVAQAQQAPAGFYASGSAGMLLLDNVDVRRNGLAGEFDYVPGYTFNGSIGYRLGNGIRIEGELGYGHAKIDSLSLNGVTGNFKDADVHLFSGMANVFYDFDLGSRFRPYVGAGVGVMHARVSSSEITVGGVTQGVPGNNSTDLAVMGEVGIGMPITEQWELVPSYRYLWVDNKQNGVDSNTGHLFKLGLRYAF